MDIEDDYLVMVDPIENKVLNKQAITSIRVWGVGRDNGRYVFFVCKFSHLIRIRIIYFEEISFF